MSSVGSARLQAWTACCCLALLWRTIGAVKIVITPGATECLAEPVDQEHFEVRQWAVPLGPWCASVLELLLFAASQIPGGPRIDGRVLVTGYSQYYVPFITIRVRHAQPTITDTASHSLV